MKRQAKTQTKIKGTGLFWSQSVTSPRPTLAPQRATVANKSAKATLQQPSDLAPGGLCLCPLVPLFPLPSVYLPAQTDCMSRPYHGGSLSNHDGGDIDGVVVFMPLRKVVYDNFYFLANGCPQIIIISFKDLKAGFSQGIKKQSQIHRQQCFWGTGSCMPQKKFMSKLCSYWL